MKPGDIAFAATGGMLGRLIRFGTRSRYNHVRLIVTHRGDVIEANPTGAEFGKVQPGDMIVSVPLDDEQRARILTAALEHIWGKPYAWVDVVVLALAQFGIKPRWVKRRMADPDKLFCSQLVDYAWYQVGYRAFRDGRTWLDVTPGDLADLAFREGWPAKVVKIDESEDTAP